MELERAEHGAGDEGLERRCVRTGSPSGATAGIEVATASRSRVARASAAPARRTSIGRASPTPTSSTSRSAGLASVPSGTGTSAISPTAPVIRAQLGDAEQVDLDRLDQVGGAGTEQDAGLVVAGGAGQYRQRHRVDTDDGGREEIAECELGG